MQPKKFSKSKNTLAITTSEVDFLLMSDENEVNLVGDKLTWVVVSGGSFHLTPYCKCFSSYRARDLGSVKMGNEGACQIVNIGDVSSDLNQIQTCAERCPTWSARQ